MENILNFMQSKKMFNIFGCCKKLSNRAIRGNKVTFSLPEKSNNMRNKGAREAGNMKRVTVHVGFNPKYVYFNHSTSNYSDDDDDYDDLDDGAPPSDMEVSYVTCQEIFYLLENLSLN